MPTNLKCTGRDSNSYTLRRWNLNTLEPIDAARLTGLAGGYPRSATCQKGVPPAAPRPSSDSSRRASVDSVCSSEASTKKAF